MKNDGECILRLHTAIAGAAIFDFYQSSEGAPLLLRILNVAGMIPGNPWTSVVDFQLSPTIIIEQPCQDPLGLLPMHPCFEGDPGVNGDQDLPGVPSICVTKNCDQDGPVAAAHCRDYGWSAPEIVLESSMLAKAMPSNVTISAVSKGTVVVIQDLVNLSQSTLPVHLRVYIESPKVGAYLPNDMLAWDPTPVTIELRSQPQQADVPQSKPFSAAWMKPIVAECATSLIESGSWLPGQDSIGVEGLLQVFSVCPSALSVVPAGATAEALLLTAMVVGPCCVIATWLPLTPPLPLKPDAMPLDLESSSLNCPCPSPTLYDVPPPKKQPPLDLTSEVVGDVQCCMVANWMGWVP